MPPMPTHARDGRWVPTGKSRYRIGWRGRLILQIEIAERTGRLNEGCGVEWTGYNMRWRDANAFDLQERTAPERETDNG